ncbi:hypothetical protein HFO26_24925 [Rhizobium leguminosarum]|uniref:hypothetical protein n=1 Tax=Rhizobium leguminosarum TaxID=384 RepID=UPI001C9882E6|nr:hypothetical protein [Rhizobium leguminosarum]MBY5733498.1 hypothetical protein [Rhizobium leguminosarum]
MSSLRVLCQIDFASEVVRLYEGSGGPFVGEDGNIWRACVLTEDALDQVEMAINAEAFTLSLTLNGVDEMVSQIIWDDYQAGEVIGARMRILLQELDGFEQPVGAPDIMFTGTIDNLMFDDAVGGDQVISAITIEVTNQFTLRGLANGGVLSDVDQRLRSALLNPSAPPDRACERIPGLLDKTIVWPRWN